MQKLKEAINRVCSCVCSMNEKCVEKLLTANSAAEKCMKDGKNVLDGLDVSGDAGTAAKTAFVTAIKADHGNGHLFVAYYTFGRFHIWVYIWLVHKSSGYTFGYTPGYIHSDIHLDIHLAST